jgi:alpha-methylacyl-CoA racemase
MGRGPLDGIRIIELAGIGPGPFCGMLLADMGADVLRLDRAGSVRDTRPATPGFEATARSRPSVGIDLKHPDGVAAVLRMVEQADGLFEGNRPGVAERLGLGPEDCWARNPRLVYGRMTGWGQDGPLSQAAGHDINYIALSGVLHAIGHQGERPVPPLNLIGDFGGGGLLLAFGMVCGILEAQRSGRGQVVDAAMFEGAALLATMIFGLVGAGAWKDERGVNMLDSGIPHYDTYETADGKWISLGSLEPQFYAELLERTGLAAEGDVPDRDTDKVALRERFARLFKSRTRDEWDTVLGTSDACFAPVLAMKEAPYHPHAVARGTFVDTGGGQVVPGPAPRFSRTPGAVQRPAEWPGQSTDEGLGAWGFSPDEITDLRSAGAVK